MAFIRNIPGRDLLSGGKPAGIVVKTMQEIPQQELTEEPHRHNYYTILWVLRAEGAHRIDLETYSLEPETLFFVPPEQVHQVRTAGVPEGYVILFTPDFLARHVLREPSLSGQLFRKHIPLKTGENTAALKEIAEKMHGIFRSESVFKEEKLGAYLQLFLLECLSFSGTDPEEKKEDPETIRRFRALVEEHYTEWHKVGDYAGKLFITPNYLNEIANKHLGRTAKRYIVDRLVAEARRLAYFTDLSSKEIGFRLGFEDPSHFTKFIKKHTGQPLKRG